MKYFSLIALLSMLLCFSTASSQENTEANQRVSVYLHPLSLFTTLGVGGLPLMLYVTGEVPLSGSNSLIVSPSLFAGGGDNNIDFFRIGSGVGLRRFAGGNASGLYLQAMPSFQYMKLSQKIFGIETNSTITTFDILGYIGYSAKYSGISVFIDFGLGYALRSAKGSVEDDDDTFFSPSADASGLTFDINLGIGIPF